MGPDNGVRHDELRMPVLQLERRLELLHLCLRWGIPLCIGDLIVGLEDTSSVFLKRQGKV